MFSVGDKIMYGGTGVCEVTEITTLNIPGVAKNRQYYVLQPLFQKGTIRVPVDSDKVQIHPVLTREEAESLIDMIPEIEASACNEKNLSALRNHYQEQIRSFDCADLVKMTMSIYEKKKDAESRQKKIGLTDEKYLRRAEDLLFGELSIALDIPRESVQEYIEQRLKSLGE